jgi:Glyoxalase superfamily protein
MTIYLNCEKPASPNGPIKCNSCYTEYNITFDNIKAPYKESGILKCSCGAELVKWNSTCLPEPTGRVHHLPHCGDAACNRFDGEGCLLLAPGGLLSSHRQLNWTHKLQTTFRMKRTIPILRIFDYDKAVEFYINWLSFKIDWENKPDNSQIYLQISLGYVVLHLSEHYGDSTPGSGVYTENFKGLKKFHSQISAIEYKYYKPGLQKPMLKSRSLCMDIIDPFGNRLSFNEA